MSSLEFFVDGDPQPKQRPVTVRLKKTGRVVTFTPKKTLSYEGLIRAHALRAVRLSLWPKPTDRDRFHVVLVLYFKDERRQDVDNFLKSILDGMRPHVYLDDSQVASIVVFRVLCSGRPGVSIAVNHRGETRGMSHVDYVQPKEGAL